jgi:hypothetical protein
MAHSYSSTFPCLIQIAKNAKKAKDAEELLKRVLLPDFIFRYFYLTTPQLVAFTLGLFQEASEQKKRMPKSYNRVGVKLKTFSYANSKCLWQQARHRSGYAGRQGRL